MKMKEEEMRIQEMEIQELKDPDLGKNCINQIYYLKDREHVKIKTIEECAGVRVGYLSRYHKMEHPPLPSAEVILAASKLLHLSVEELVFNHDYLLSPTEEKIASFIDGLAEDTFSQELKWQKETKEYLEDLDEALPFSDCSDLHPLYRHRHISTDDEKTGKNSRIVCGYFGYNSKENEMPAELLDPLYNAELPGATAVIYLAHIKHVNGNDQDEEYELSFVRDNTLIGSIGSLAACETIARLLRDLFGVVKQYFNTILLDDQITDIISDFMNRHNTLTQGDNSKKDAK